MQTIPEVSPEFTQAIVQTDISGPVTPSDLTTTALSQTEIAGSVTGTELQVTGEATERELSPEDITTVQSAEPGMETHTDISGPINQSDLSESDVSREDMSKTISDSNSDCSHITDRAVSRISTKDGTEVQRSEQVSQHSLSSMVGSPDEHVDVPYTQGIIQITIVVTIIKDSNGS